MFLVVMVDGDASGVRARKASLSKACTEQGVPPPRDSDNVLVCVPTWNIETWLAYLAGDPVNESRKDYPRLTQTKRLCPYGQGPRRHVPKADPARASTSIVGKRLH